MSTLTTEVQHQWKPMEQYHPEGNELIMVIEGETSKKEMLEKMRPNQYYTFTGKFKKLNGIIGELQEQGLDLGKGDCTYGYRLPLPKERTFVDLSTGEEVESERELIIFRRHE